MADRRLVPSATSRRSQSTTLARRLTVASPVTYRRGVPVIPLADLLELAAGPLADDQLGAPFGGGWIVTGLSGAQPDRADTATLAHLAVVLIAVGEPSHRFASAFDVIVPHDDAAAEVIAAVEEHPIAATALALLLRGTERRNVADGLIAESATYSALQSGPEHQAWLTENRRDRAPSECGSPIAVVRAGDALHITFNRPDVRNAYNAAPRGDVLIDALAIAANDPSLEVVIDGAGAVFSSGGDLNEFGTLADPAALISCAWRGAQRAHSTT